MPPPLAPALADICFQTDSEWAKLFQRSRKYINFTAPTRHLTSAAVQQNYIKKKKKIVRNASEKTKENSGLITFLPNVTPVGLIWKIQKENLN